MLPFTSAGGKSLLLLQTVSTRNMEGKDEAGKCICTNSSNVKSRCSRNRNPTPDGGLTPGAMKWETRRLKCKSGRGERTPGALRNFQRTLKPESLGLFKASGFYLPVTFLNIHFITSLTYTPQ